MLKLSHVSAASIVAESNLHTRYRYAGALRLSLLKSAFNYLNLVPQTVFDKATEPMWIAILKSTYFELQQQTIPS